MITNNRDQVGLTSTGKECWTFSSSSQMDRNVGEPGWSGEREPWGRGGEQQTESQTLQDTRSAGGCRKLWGGAPPLTLHSDLEADGRGPHPPGQNPSVSTSDWMSLCQCPGCFEEERGQAAPPIPRPSIPTACRVKYLPLAHVFLGRGTHLDSGRN